MKNNKYNYVIFIIVIIIMYTLNEDCIANIMVHTDYFSTLALLNTAKIFNIQHLWEQKCSKQYPDKPYFKSWLGKENYLVQSKKFFCIAIMFEGNVKRNLYEYDKMMFTILHLNDDFLDYQHDRDGYELIKTQIYHPFILIKKFMGRCNVFGHYKTYEEALTSLKKDCNSLDSYESKEVEHCKKITFKNNCNSSNSNNSDSDDHFDIHKYAIIDVELLIPFFLKLGFFRIYKFKFGFRNSPVTFYKNGTKL